MHGRLITETSVVFEDVKFLRATSIDKKKRLLNFLIALQKVSGNFELSENGEPVVSGRIRITQTPEKEMISLPTPVAPKNGEFIPLSQKDIYKELRLRGYNYR